MIKELSKVWIKVLLGCLNIFCLVMFTVTLVMCIMFTQLGEKDDALEYGYKRIMQHYAMDIIQSEIRAGYDGTGYKKYADSGMVYAVIESDDAEFDVAKTVYNNEGVKNEDVHFSWFDYTYISPIEYEECGYGVEYSNVGTDSVYEMLTNRGTYHCYYYDNGDVVGGIRPKEVEYIYGRDVKYVCIAFEKSNNKDVISKDYNMSCWKDVVETVYSSKIFTIIGMFLFLLIFLFTLVLLIVLMGRNDKNKKMYYTAFDKLPLELVICVFVIVEILLSALMGDMLRCDDIMMSILFLTCIEALFVALLLNLSKRAKMGRLFKYTIVKMFAKPLSRIKDDIKSNKALLGKITLYWGVLTLIQFITIVFMAAELTLSLVIFAVYKIVEYVLAVIVVYQIFIINVGAQKVALGAVDEKIDINKLNGGLRDLGENINKIGDGIADAVEERIRSERTKTELITNVSHDIKTPLTSIINYVDLLKKEKTDNETINEYIEVLDRQSIRLKKLIVDLVEASKASTGNMEVEFEACDVKTLLSQALGEFDEKLEKAGLEVIITQSEPDVIANVDGRHLWRIFDNLINNICKYAMQNTRVYVNIGYVGECVNIEFKNISSVQLNISADELMERFVRGDSSRNTEGSGLGLYIARSLTELMGGEMNIVIDGDLFKVVLNFEKIK